MHITPEQVTKLAAMSKITMSPEEAAKLVPELEAILSYVDILQEVDTEGVIPTSQVTGLVHTTYDDIPENQAFSDNIAAKILEQTGQPVEMKQIKVPNVLSHD